MTTRDRFHSFTFSLLVYSPLSHPWVPRTIKQDKQDTPSAMHFSFYSIIALGLSGSVLASPSKGGRIQQDDQARRGHSSSSEDDKQCSFVGVDGYKQFNTLLSHAHFNLRRDGTFYNLCLYNDGLPTPKGWEEVCRGTSETKRISTAVHASGTGARSPPGY